MKYKDFFKSMLLYTIVVIIALIVVNKLNLLPELKRYILFNTQTFKFQEVLSILITILTVLLGAIITASTVLISMCDKRIMILIKRFNKSKYLIDTIKISILSGVIVIILLAIIYAKLDFNIFIVRSIIMFISGYVLMIFISKSYFLVDLVISLLNYSFIEEDSIIIDSEFINPDKNKDIK